DGRVHVDSAGLGLDLLQRWLVPARPDAPRQHTTADRAAAHRAAADTRRMHISAARSGLDVQPRWLVPARASRRCLTEKVEGRRMKPDEAGSWKFDVRSQKASVCRGGEKRAASAGCSARAG